MPRLVPALARHVELQLERRGLVVEVVTGATRAFERLDLTDEDAVHQRTRTLTGGGTVDAHLGGTGVALRHLRAARVEETVLDLRAHEALVAGQLGFRKHLLHETQTSYRLFAQATGAGDAARRQVELLQSRLAGTGPLDLLGRVDQRLEQHLAVAPVVELVLQRELERADRRRVGDRARAVQVVRVHGDEPRDQHAVDADELLDRVLGRFRLADRIHEGDERVVRRNRQPVGVHLAQLGQPLVPQLRVPGVVIRVPAEHELHVELGNGRDPAAEHLEEAHLGPLVVADAAGRLLDLEQAGELTAVPGGERRARLADFRCRGFRHPGDSHRALTDRSSDRDGAQTSRPSPSRPAHHARDSAMTMPSEDDRRTDVAGDPEPLADPEADDPGDDRFERRGSPRPATARRSAAPRAAA